MPHSDEKPLPAVGAYWIEEADYPALLKLFDDSNTLPRITRSPVPATRNMLASQSFMSLSSLDRHPSLLTMAWKARS